MAVFTLAEDESWSGPAPDWFVDWVRLGIRLASRALQPAQDARRVIAVSGPTEDLASAAISFGYLRQRYLTGAARNILRSVPLDELEVGTRVWIRLADRVRTGEFRGWDDLGRFKSTSGTFLRERLVEVRELPDWLPELASEAIFDQCVDANFLSLMLRKADAVDYATTWSPDLVMVGSLSRLAQELQVRIGPADGSGQTGCLAQVIRPLRTASPIGCQSILMSSRSEQVAWAAWPAPPSVTLLRGAYATSRWLPDVQSKLAVAVLGRAEAGIEAAVAALMQSRAYGDPLTAGDLGWQPPPASEVLAFDVAA